MTEQSVPKIMVIGAHAGDAENMAGAVVLQHTRAGCTAVIVHMTLGEAGHRTLPPEVYAEQRKREVQESARCMGAKAIRLDYADGFLPANQEVKLQVADLIRQERPTILLTHWKGSFHKDHVATYEIVQDALFYAGLPSLKRSAPAHWVPQLYFPENWEDMDGWRADVYMDATEVWDEYLEMLKTHELMRGGVSTFRYYDYYNALGTTRGCLGGFQKAVALMAPDGSWTRQVKYLQANDKPV
jgi:LmbE family N-acetylglucosaminyl deacetylase